MRLNQLINWFFWAIDKLNWSNANNFFWQSNVHAILNVFLSRNLNSLTKVSSSAIMSLNSDAISKEFISCLEFITTGSKYIKTYEVKSKSFICYINCWYHIVTQNCIKIQNVSVYFYNITFWIQINTYFGVVIMTYAYIKRVLCI